MRVTITIDCDNDDFGDTLRSTENGIIRCLRETIERIKTDGMVNVSRIFDINGNTVGRLEITE